MDNPDPQSGPDPEWYASETSPDDGQPPNTASNYIQTEVSGIVDDIIDLREAMVRLGAELTALSNQLGEDGGDLLGVSRLNSQLLNELDIEELESTTSRIYGFRRNIHDQVSQLSETARFWLQQDQADIASMPPVAPPGSPSAPSQGLGGPSFASSSHLMVEMPQLLLGGGVPPPAARQSDPVGGPEVSPTHDYDEFPVLMSSSDSSDDEFDDDDYRTIFEAVARPSRFPTGIPNHDYYGMPGLMSVSESSDDAASTEYSEADEGASLAESDREQGPREDEQEEIPRQIPYTREPWVTPGSWLHQLLMQGQAPQDSTPPSLGASDAGQIPRLSATAQLLEMAIPDPLESSSETRTADFAWRISRMKKLLESLEVLNKSMLDRFCQVGGGGGEHSDQCMICWESLKAEPMGEQSWTTVENALLEENGQGAPSTGNISTNSGPDSPPPISMDVSGAVALPCLHAFHSKCLVTWFNKLATTCPVCRFDLDPRKLLLFSRSPLSTLRRMAGLSPGGFPTFHSRWYGDPHNPPVGTSWAPGGLEIGLSIRQAPLAEVPLRLYSFPGVPGDTSSESSEESVPLLFDSAMNPVRQPRDNASEQSSDDSIPAISDSLPNPDNDAGGPSLSITSTSANADAHDAPNTSSTEVVTTSNPGDVDSRDSDDEQSVVSLPPGETPGHDVVVGETAVEGLGNLNFDPSTSLDEMPGLIDINDDIDPSFSSPGMERSPPIVREETRGTYDTPRRFLFVPEHEGNAFFNTQAGSTTIIPQQVAFRNFAAETRSFLSEMQDTLLSAYVRFSNIPTESARTQADHWESLASPVNAAVRFPPPPVNELNAQGIMSNPLPPLWMSSQDTARREWVLPKGPVEGGIASWINRREAEIRADLEARQP